MGMLAAALIASGALDTKQSVARDAFFNAIRILHSLDAHELPGVPFDAFNDNPAEFLMRADDPTTDAIWSAIQKRQPARYRA